MARRTSRSVNGTGPRGPEAVTGAAAAIDRVPVPGMVGDRTRNPRSQNGRGLAPSGRMSVVGYVRVSTDDQVDNHSLDAQRREITRYCERQDYQLAGFFTDEGVSAYTEEVSKRPQLVALLEAAASRSFDVVIVHTLDRWARNIGVQRQALQRLGDANVGFASVTENIDFTTPAGRLMLNMIGGVSEFFSDQLGVHVAKGQRERAETGLPVGPVPFGYKVDEAGGVPAIVPDEGRAVRQVFERRAAGESTGELASWLNAQGLNTLSNLVVGSSAKWGRTCYFDRRA